MNLFTTRTRGDAGDAGRARPPPETWYDAIVRKYDMVIAGPSRYGERFMNSVIIGFGSTFLSHLARDAGGLRLLAASGCRSRTT